MLKRIITAIVLITLVVSVLFWAPIWLFKVLVLALIVGALYEFYRLTLHNDCFSLVTGILFSLIFAVPLVFWGMSIWLLPLFILGFFILILLHMGHFTTTEGMISRIGVVLFGAGYIGLTVPAFVWLRVSDHGRSLIVITVAIVALGDTFAYAFGKAVGKRKMSPLISPNKTVEGFIASFFGGVAASCICWQVFWKELPLSLIIFLGLSVALIGAMGDLVESLIKRSCHVKDSGQVLPGHGGVLDRIDALIFAAPFVYFTFKLTGWI